MFYPQDGTNVMPYWDFYGGKIRVTQPWRAVGKFTGTLALPDWPALAPTNRNLNFIGIDRYMLTEDLKMSRCTPITTWSASCSRPGSSRTSCTRQCGPRWRSNEVSRH